MSEPPATPVRLACCITELDPGGAERAFVRIVTGLDRTQFEPHVFCLGPRGPLADELEQHSIPVHCFGATHWWHVGVFWRLTRALQRLQPDILQTFLYHANITGRIAGRLAGVPRIVAGIRVAERRGRLRAVIDRLTSRLVDVHVCVSRDVARFSIEEGGLPAERVLVIPNGVDCEERATAKPADLAEFGIPPGALVVLFAGRLDEQKNPALLVTAFGGVLREVSSAHLLIVGTGPLENELRSHLASAPELTGTVHLAGFREDLPRLMRAATVFALPSRWEGMPNVVLEAMAAGLPVVSTDVEGVRELLSEGPSGVVVPPEDSRLLERELVRLLMHPEMRQNFGRNSQHIVKQRFTWESVIANYAELYLNLLQNRVSMSQSGQAE